MDISAALQQASETLKDAGIAEPVREARSLLSYVLDREPAYLFAHSDGEISSGDLERFHRLVERRAAREPFQYITGKQEFFGLEFAVVPGVLIPRPETELIVEEAVKLLTSAQPLLFEIGLGSGCISISVLHFVRHARAVASDISDKAFHAAIRNAEMHGVSSRLQIRKGDLFAGFEGRCDLLVCNPPYVPLDDLGTLQPEVVNWEPHEALFAGSDGLSVIRRILSEGRQHLKPGGNILMEIGFGQSESVGEIASAEGWQDIGFIKDLQEIPRTLKATA